MIILLCSWLHSNGLYCIAFEREMMGISSWQWLFL